MFVRYLSLILVLASLAVTPLAYAGQPDPNWDSSFDDRSDDDAIATIASAVAVVDVPSVTTGALLVVPGYVDPGQSVFCPKAPARHTAPRAPPSR